MAADPAHASALPDVVELVATMMRDFRPTGIRPAVTALGAADLRDVLTTIAVPTLLIYGDADVRSPADVVGRDMHARIPGSTLVVIPTLRIWSTSNNPRHSAQLSVASLARMTDPYAQVAA